MLCHITRVRLVIIFLWDRASGCLFSMGNEMSLTLTFHSPFPKKMYLARFRNELFFNWDFWTKGNSFLVGLWYQAKLITASNWENKWKDWMVEKEVAQKEKWQGDERNKTSNISHPKFKTKSNLYIYTVYVYTAILSETAYITNCSSHIACCLITFTIDSLTFSRLL